MRWVGVTARVRPGLPEDLCAIAVIHAESWRDTYRGIMEDAYLDGPVFTDRRALWTGIFADMPDQAVLLVAELDGSVAGFLYAVPDKDPEWHLLDNLHVSQAARSAGIGAMLMRDAARRLSAMGRGKVRLLVMEENRAARRFYERLGGRPQPVVQYGFRGLGPFASIPFVWDDFGALAERA